MDPKKCVICHENPVKYTCPRCSRRTCSLNCCLKHKKTFECNGQRDRTSFKTLETMTDLDLLSDYRFLEGVQRCVDGSERDPLGNQMKSFNDSTRQEKFLQNKLKSLASIRILFLPKFSTRHKQNRMSFDRRTDDVLWHVECRFYCSTVENFFVIWSIFRLPTSETTLENLLAKSPKEIPKEQNDISVFIENFGQQRKQNGKYEKLPFQTLSDLFRHRTFIEFPILFLCRSSDENSMLKNLM